MFIIYYLIDFAYNFLAEFNNIDEMFKRFIEFNNVINELKIDYLAGEDEDIDNVIENASLVCDNQ